MWCWVRVGYLGRVHSVIYPTLATIPSVPSPCYPTVHRTTLHYSISCLTPFYPPVYTLLHTIISSPYRSVHMAKRLALPTSDHGVAGSNPAGGQILPEPKRRFIAQRISYSHFYRLEMTEILLKGT